MAEQVGRYIRKYALACTEEEEHTKTAKGRATNAKFSAD